MTFYTITIDGRDIRPGAFAVCMRYLIRFFGSLTCATGYGKNSKIYWYRKRYECSVGRRSLALTINKPHRSPGEASGDQ